MRALSQTVVILLLLLAAAWWWREPLMEAVDEVREEVEARVDPAAGGIRPFGGDERAGTPSGPKGESPAARHQPGDALIVDLAEEPASHYGQARMSESDRHYASLARRANGLRYEAAMGHAARELAGFHSQHGRLASGEILSFLLDAGGAAEWTVEQLVTTTSREGDGPIEDLLKRASESWRRGAPPLRIGVGEAWSLGRPARRHLIALVSRGRLELDRVPREVPLGSSLRVTGRVPYEIPECDILVMGPDLVVKDAAVTRQGDRFETIIPMGEEAGQTWIELIGLGASGPKPMAQLSVYVGEEVPWSFDTHWPPDESHLRTVADAEAHAFMLFQSDRERFGLPPSRRSDSLDQVARAHSEDMAQGRFFAHVSPNTGSVSDRLKAAGIKTVFHGENIARNEVLSDAEAGLMRSIGHRRNILHPRASEVGIGVAPIGTGAQRQWLLTQVVARPAPVIDPAEIERQVGEAIDEARAEADRRRFKHSRALERSARAEALSERPSPQGALDRAEARLSRGGWAWVATLGELEDLQVPEKVLDKRWRKIGIGVYQDLERDGPNIVVVLIVGG